MGIQLHYALQRAVGQIHIPRSHDYISLLSYVNQPHVLACKRVWGKKLQNCTSELQKVQFWEKCKLVCFIQQSWNVRFYFTGFQIEVSQNCALCEQNQDLKPLSWRKTNQQMRISLKAEEIWLMLQSDKQQLHWPLAGGLWRSMCFHSLLLKKTSVLNAINCLATSDNTKI